MNAKKTASMLEDRKVNVKVVLALLWVGVLHPNASGCCGCTYGSSSPHGTTVPNIESQSESISEHHRRHIPYPCPCWHSVCGRWWDLAVLEALRGTGMPIPCAHHLDCMEVAY